MGNDKAKMGEGFTAGKVGSPPPEDRKKTLQRRMTVGLGVTAIGVAVALYGWFGVFFPAYKEYRQLVGDHVKQQEQLEGVKFRRGAERLEHFEDGPDFVLKYGVADKRRLTGKLSLLVARADGSVEDYGTLSNLIVNAGENFLVDAFQNLTEPENLRFHGIGTGAVAAAETDTGCGTELTTQYNPDNTRATGSLTEGASTNIFRTVGTNTVDAAVAITEFCLMSQAATGGGTIWSRVVFSAINLASGDSLQTTYDLTVESMLAWWWLGSLFCWFYLSARRRQIAVAVLLILLVAVVPASAGSVTLIWDPVTGATGYDIEQSVDNGTIWTVVASPVPAACTGTPVTCRHTLTAPSTGLVLFRYSAKNAVGKGTRFGEGAWHNETWKPPVSPAGVGIQ